MFIFTHLLIYVRNAHDLTESHHGIKVETVFCKFYKPV